MHLSTLPQSHPFMAGVEVVEVVGDDVNINVVISFYLFHGKREVT